MEKKAVTIKEIARLSGVSITTVSLVLNNRPNTISEKTKQRIWKITKEHDYRPNGIARSLAMKKSNTIGIIIPDISNSFFAESVKSLQIELDKQGYTTLLCNTEEKFANDIKSIKLLADRQVDGLILTISAESMLGDNIKQLKQLLNSLPIPVVLYDRYYDGHEPKVYVDNQKGAYELTKYLIELGHREIGLITGPLDLASTQGRLNGVIQALNEAGLSLKQDHIYTANFDIDSGRLGAQHLMGKVTAIFAFNDLLAYGVLDAANNSHLNIPNDISLVGFDDIFYSAMLDLKLTTVSQPIKEMTKEICSLMVRMIDNQEKCSLAISIPGQLVKRDSVMMINGASEDHG